MDDPVREVEELCFVFGCCFVFEFYGYNLIFLNVLAIDVFAEDGTLIGGRGVAECHEMGWDVWVGYGLTTPGEVGEAEAQDEGSYGTRTPEV